jgi:hypothetical protein
MEIMKMKKNRSHLDNCSFFDNDNDDDRNELEKSFVTVHADSFSERDFDKLLDCLDTLRESEKKKRRQNRKRSIKNYCMRVPLIDNSKNNSKVEENNISSYDDFDKTCDELKSNISQMFSYFEEDVNLDFDDEGRQSLNTPNSPHPATAQEFRDKFLRNRNRINESFKVHEDTKPIIKGAIKKANAPTTTNTSLNKNQVDKIVNEFNRVKINYYSKENYVEFTNIDYFYCDTSDIDSIRSEKVGKLDQNVVSKFEEKFIDENNDVKSVKRTPSMALPKNSVRDKINMFSQMNFTAKLDMPKITNNMKDEQQFKLPKRPIMASSIFKNSSLAHKNQNKCYIKDINNSLLRGSTVQVEKKKFKITPKATEIIKKTKKNYVDESSSTTLDIVEKIQSMAKLNDVNLLMKLENIINKLNMSLLHTIDGLINDGVFDGSCMKNFNVETRPSFEKFNETFNKTSFEVDFMVKDAELCVIDENKIKLQIRVNLNKDESDEKIVNVNVIFMARYDNHQSLDNHNHNDDNDDNTFSIYFISLFEVL